MNLITNFKLNFIKKNYIENQCFYSNTCYACQRIEDAKTILQRLKRVKNTIKHKGCHKSARIEKMLKNSLFV